jgi:fermentation-respiration switch protein FrsA (DUF1100 family)
MKKSHLFLLLAISLIACQRLDSNLFNNDNSIQAYKFDGFEGEVDFVLDPSYNIPDSLIHLFNLNSEGYKIYAIYIGDTNAIQNDTVIFYAHGNKWHMDFYWQRAKLLAHTGGKNRFGVLMIDYRGYGLSVGEPSEDALYKDSEAAIGWLKEKGLTGNRLMMYGFSLGSAPSTKLSATPGVLTPAALILENPFASVAVMIHDAAVMAMPAEYYTNIKVDVAEQIKNVDQPFMWMHGVADDFLSLKNHGEIVYSNYSGKHGEAHRIEGANHGSLPNTWGYQNYLNALENFITRNQ